MPSIDFFASTPEMIRFVEYLLRQGCQFIPDMKYGSASIETIIDRDYLTKVAKDNPTFYILRGDLVQSSIKLREVNLEKHFFYVEPRTGGPTLFLYWGREYSEKSRTYLGATNIGFYPWYINSVTRERETPGRDFRKFFAGVAKTVKQERRGIAPSVREYWISPEVEKRVREGLLLIGLEHFTPSQILNSDAN